jgi:hypothetical protein
MQGTKNGRNCFSFWSKTKGRMLIRRKAGAAFRKAYLGFTLIQSINPIAQGL